MAPVWRVLGLSLKSRVSNNGGGVARDPGCERTGVPAAVPGVGLALLITTIFMTVFRRQLGPPQMSDLARRPGGTESA